MKKNSRILLLLLVFFVSSAVPGFAVVPAVSVTVKQKGKVVKQAQSDSDGNFVIGTLPRGDYSLEFRARRSDSFKQQTFSIGVDGIKQSGSQGGISGDSLIGGVAVNVEVASGSTVRGQIAIGQMKKLVWIPPMLGSNLPGRWAEEGSAEEIFSRTRGNVRREAIQRIQDKAVGMR
jgi:carboxypeptidase family protein